MFSILNSSTGLLRYYRTPNIMTSEHLQPRVTSVNDIPYLLVPTDHSFHIYKMQDLTLHFVGPRFNRVDCILYDAFGVLLCEETRLHLIIRSDIVATYEMGVRAVAMVKFGGYLAVLGTSSEVLIFEYASLAGSLVSSDVFDELSPVDYTENNFSGEQEGAKPKRSEVFVTELYRMALERKATGIFHPHTYTNKLVILYTDGTADLYNINTRKTVFSFSFGQRIDAIAQTSVLDVIGLVLADGSVVIFNLKKNAIVFTISEHQRTSQKMAEDENGVGSQTGTGQARAPDATLSGGMASPPSLSFVDNFALAVLNNCLIVYDLELKKEVFAIPDCLSGIFINREVFLAVARNGILLYSMDDFTILKKRETVAGQITAVENFSDREIILFTENSLFKMHVYKDEQNCFFKNTTSIQAAAVDDDILTYGQNEISLVAREGAFQKVIERRCSWIRTYKNTCFFGHGRQAFIMNSKSKRLILKHEEAEEILDADYDPDKYTLLLANKIISYNYSKQAIFSSDTQEMIMKAQPIRGLLFPHLPELPDPPASPSRLVCRGNLYILQLPRYVLVICGTASKLLPGSAFSIDSSSRFLSVSLDNCLYLYDLITGKILDQLTTTANITHSIIIDHMKFVGIVDSRNRFHLLSNQSLLTRIQNSYGPAISARQTGRPLEMTIERARGKFETELAIAKDFRGDADLVAQSLTRNEVNELLGIIEANIEQDFFDALPVLNRILLYKSHLIEPGRIERLLPVVARHWSEYNESLVRAFGYLKVSRDAI